MGSSISTAACTPMHLFSPRQQPPAAPPAVLLVIDSGAQKADWSTIFAGASLPSGRGVRVVQAAWGDIFVSAQSRGNHRALVHVRVEGRMVTVQPDMCLIRNEVRGAEPGQDYRNTLFGLMYA